MFMRKVNYPCFVSKIRKSGARVKVSSGLSYDIRQTFNDNILRLNQFIRQDLSDSLPEGEEFEFGAYRSEVLQRSIANSDSIRDILVSSKDSQGQPPQGASPEGGEDDGK